MNKLPAQVSGTVDAWFSHDYYGPEDIIRAPGKAVGLLSYSEHDMSNQGWTRAGKATITVELLSPTEMVDAKVDGLNAERKKLMADYQMALTGIDTKLQQLLAITNDSD